MVNVTKKFFFACVLVSYVTKIQAAPKTKFSFKKTFFTPKDVYDKRNEELDKCEILERSNFSSDEVEDKRNPVVKPKQDASKAVANAHIHVRFGGESEPPPTARYEKFIEMSEKVPEKEELFYQPAKIKEENTNHLLPPSVPCHHYPPLFPAYNPYYPFAPYALPYGQMHSSYHSYLPCPCQCHHNSNLCKPPNHGTNENPENQKKNFDCFKQNIFQIVKIKNDNEPGSYSATTKPPLNVTAAPYVHLFARDKNSSPEELTIEDLELLEKQLGLGDSCDCIRSSDIPETTSASQCRTTPATTQSPSTQYKCPNGHHVCTCTINETSPTTVNGCKITTTLPTTVCESTTSGPHGCTEPITEPPSTCDVPRATTTSCENSTTQNLPSTKCEEVTSPKCPQESTSSIEDSPPRSLLLPGDVVLHKVIHPAPCKASYNHHECLKLSDNLKYVKVNLSEIINEPCNRPSSCEDSNSEEDKGCEASDIDDLVKVEENSLCHLNEMPWPSYQQPYPFVPYYGNQRYMNFYPWWLPRDEFLTPGWYRKINGLDFYRNYMPDPRFYGNFIPEHPPFLSGNGFYDWNPVGPNGNLPDFIKSCKEGCTCPKCLNYTKELNDY